MYEELIAKLRDMAAADETNRVVLSTAADLIEGTSGPRERKAPREIKFTR